MTTLYIAGPMRGHADHNFPAFAEAAARLRAAGYGVVSPHELHSGAIDLPWSEYMRRDIALLCSGVIGGVAFLDGWRESKGAMMEWEVAAAIGLPCRTLAAWMEKAAHA